MCGFVSGGTPRPSVEEGSHRKRSAETRGSCLVSRLEKIKASIPWSPWPPLGKALEN